MTRAAEYRHKAEDYEALILKTDSGDLLQHYKVLARQYRALAEDEDKLDTKTPATADHEIEQLAERMTGTPASKH